MPDDEKPDGKPPAQPDQPQANENKQAAPGPPDPQVSPPLQDPKTRGQEAALESALGDPSVQAEAPKAAVPKAVPPPSAPIEGGAPTKPQAGAPGVPPKPAAPPAKPATPAAKPAAPAAPKAPAVMAVKPWESDLTRALEQQFAAKITEFSTYLGQNFLVAKPDAAVSVLEYLKLEADFDYLVDITAVDYPKNPERFDLVYVVYSFARNERIRIKTRVPDGYKPPTATGVHVTANWLEREVFDMFGIEFAGHPDMKRILLPDEWQGHPLRKDKSITDMDNRWVQDNLSIESGQ